MSERRFALVDFMHMIRVGCRRLYEAGNNYTLPRAVAHAATKRALVMSGSGVGHPAMSAAHPLTCRSRKSHLTDYENLIMRAACDFLPLIHI